MKSYVDQYIHMNRPRVVLAQNSKIEVAVNNVLTQLDLPDLNGKRILLKPNVGREEFSTVAINTNPKVVEIIFHFLKKSYKCDVFIGDSPIVGADTREAFRKSGYDSLLKEEITYLDLDEPKPTTLPIQDGKILQSIRVTGYWNDFDYIISIPVLKMHMHTGASLSFKNCKGLIYKRDKVKLHHYDFPDLVAELRTPDFMVKELDIAIADLYPTISPDLAIIDATFAQEGMGPSSGNPVRMDLIIGSLNFLAADVMALRIAQPSWSLNHVPHLKMIAQKMRVKGVLDANNDLISELDLEIIPEDWKKYQHEIESAPTSISIRYPNVIVHDIDSCSACLSTIFLFLKNYRSFIDQYFTAENPLSLAIGKGLSGKEFYEPTFLVGNCTLNRKADGIFVKGCAPVQSTIYKTIIDYLKEKGVYRAGSEIKLPTS